MADVRVANVNDWPTLTVFYERAYREGHPIRNQSFWKWRFGTDGQGVALIATDSDSVVGHVGVNLCGGVAWIIQTYLDEEWRGKGLLGRLYGLAGEFGPLAATNVNLAGQGMYRKMGWHELVSLERFVLVDPALKPKNVVVEVKNQIPWSAAGGHHYWNQPGIRGHVAPDGSSFVNALEHGGIRAIEIMEPETVLGNMRSIGANWVDYATSWNDPLCEVLLQNGWVREEDAQVPWLLNPPVAGSRMNGKFFSREYFPPDRIIRRWDSDHGRVGTLP